MSLGRLKPRKEVIEQFSEFLDLKENSSSYITIPWRRILPLKNNMQRHMKSCSANGTSYWLKYWWQEACFSNSTCAKYHLSASLEEACYWVTKRIHKQLCPQDKSLFDYFQITRYAALTPQIFSKYQDSRGMQLKTYLQSQVERFLLKVAWQGKEEANYSNWGLLRNKSKKFTQNALIQAGIKEQQQYRCMLALQCFREIYTPREQRGQLQEPTSEELTAFAELYNQLRSPQEPAVNGDDIKTLLNICINTARASNASPLLFSHNAPNYSGEDIEHLSNEHLRSPTPDISQEQVQQEERAQQIKAVLAEAIKALPKSGQTMLQLWHGLRLTQTDIGKLTSLRQYQVSRQLKHHKRLLLNALAEWSRTQMEIELNVEKINELQGALDEWLDWYYSSFFHAYLRTILINELKNEIPLLKRYYGQGLSQMEVGNELNLSETAVNQRLDQTKQHLQMRLYNWVKDTHDLWLNALNLTVEPIADLVEQLLTNFKYEFGNQSKS